MAAPSVLFCSATDLDTYLSATGVLSRADDNKDGTSEPLAIAMAINVGTLEVAKYIQRRYLATQLANSMLVNYFATVFACAFLCRRRGNPLPESLAEELDVIIGQLEDIRDGRLDIPDVMERTARSPVVVNQRADARFSRPLRRQLNQSTPTGKKSNTGIDFSDQINWPR